MIDSEFEERVAAVTWMLSFAGDPAEVVGGKRVVEIGSGYGVGAIACLRNGAAQYVGIEPEPFGARVIQLDGSDPGYRVCYERAAKSIDKRRALFFEGFADDWPGSGFDICLISDVLEHVEDPNAIAGSANRLLRQGGKVIASTCPLYYSAYGHHLFDALSNEPWAHLYEEFNKVSVIHETSAYLISEFESLNGITHAELLEAFWSSGFSIDKERTLPHEGVDFETVRHRIKAELIERIPEQIFEQSVSQFVAIKS